MKTIASSFIIEDPLDGDEILKRIERAGRTCYKSEERITPTSARTFVKKLLNMGHESVIEHEKLTVRIVCDRGITHEIVRHRVASYSQESTRYCNYTKDKFENEITFIEPCFWPSASEKERGKYTAWRESMEAAERSYFKLIELGASPQEARSVLPNSLKTEIVVTMNLRSWRNFLQQRTASAAHPQMREIARPLLDAFKAQIPVIFDDITY